MYFNLITLPYRTLRQNPYRFRILEKFDIKLYIFDLKQQFFLKIQSMN